MQISSEPLGFQGRFVCVVDASDTTAKGSSDGKAIVGNFDSCTRMTKGEKPAPAPEVGKTARLALGCSNMPYFM